MRLVSVLRGLFSWCGYKQYGYEYERQGRFAGKTKYPLWKMLKLASDGIISFSNKPLKLVGTLGIFYFWLFREAKWRKMGQVLSRQC